jgi:hypothetical protein
MRQLPQWKSLRVMVEGQLQERTHQVCVHQPLKQLLSQLIISLLQTGLRSHPEVSKQ